MKKIIQLISLSYLIFSASTTFAQTENIKTKQTLEKPYKPDDNAQEKINTLIVKAKKENKNIILQAGGNWCVWCLRFNDFIKNTKSVKTELNNNFLYYHLNFSSENKNSEVFDKYAPDGNKLGYPFFIVLDSQGKVLGLQESSSLEKGTSYSEEKVLTFLKKYKNN